jgi:hypothetical protein
LRHTDALSRAELCRSCSLYHNDIFFVIGSDFQLDAIATGGKAPDTVPHYATSYRASCCCQRAASTPANGIPQ